MWMKSPRFDLVATGPSNGCPTYLPSLYSLFPPSFLPRRLTQLLEEWPKPSAKEEAQFPTNSVSESDPSRDTDVSHAHDDTTLPNTTTPTWTNLRDITGQTEKPVSGGDSGKEPSENEVPSSSLAQLRSPLAGKEERKLDREREGMVGRKRSSSVRDSMELVGGSDGEEMGTVLQEADSTVTIEQPQVVSMEEASPKKLRDTEEGDLSPFVAHSDSTSLKSLLERTLPRADELDLPEAKLRERDETLSRHRGTAANDSSSESGESCHRSFFLVVCVARVKVLHGFSDYGLNHNVS